MEGDLQWEVVFTATGTEGEVNWLGGCEGGRGTAKRENWGES